MKRSFHFFTRLFFLALFIFIMMTPRSYSSTDDKQPNVSGQFYPADTKSISTLIDKFFAESSINPSSQNVKIIIAPHAGYVYSGHVAADSFKAAGGGKYSTVVLIGPSHFFDFPGVSVWARGSFQTPLGAVTIDEDFTAALLKADSDASFNRDVFEREHALEVELPFLQKTFKDFKIVPVLMGRPDLKVCETLARTLKQLIGDREDVLIVISTDMSHYHSDEQARRMDQKTLALIKVLDPQTLWKQCILRETELCGFTAVLTALIYARLQEVTDVQVLKYANSGDVSGETSRVVGYCSIVFAKPISPGEKTGSSASESYSRATPAHKESFTLTTAQRMRLIDIAQDTIHHYLATGKILEVADSDPALQKNEGAFVTLHKNGSLRGCIGEIIGAQPLYLTVRDMAISAASEDPRFPPVSKEEINFLEVEISVLSIPRVITDVNQIQMGVHGVIVSRGRNRGLFLPQVATETGWGREKFLSELCSQKAGLPADCWKDPSTRIEVFTAEVFSKENID